MRAFDKNQYSPLPLLSVDLFKGQSNSSDTLKPEWVTRSQWMMLEAMLPSSGVPTLNDPS